MTALQIVLSKEGPLQAFATLGYVAWVSLRTVRERWRFTSRQRTLEPVLDLACQVDSVLFLCNRATGYGQFATAYWNHRLEQAGLDAPRASCCGLRDTESSGALKPLRQLACRLGFALETPGDGVPAASAIPKAGMIFAIGAADRDYLARHHCGALQRTYCLSHMGPSGSTKARESETQGPEQLLRDCRRMEAAVDNTVHGVLTRHRGPRHALRIFNYHAILGEPIDIDHYCFLDRGLFRRQLELIAKSYLVLPLSDAVTRLQAGALTQPSAAITFDDGFYDNFSVALPELRSLGIPATVFVSTGFIDRPETPWFCRILRALMQTNCESLTWNRERLGLSSRFQRSLAASRLMSALKGLPQERVEEEVDAIEVLSGSEAGRPLEPESPFRMLDTRAIRTMTGSGLIEFGAHTHSHSILSRLPAALQKVEIQRSIEDISHILGTPCRTFAYPNGQPQDYDVTSISCLRESGVTAAVTTVAGPNLWFDNQLELHRDSLGPTDSPKRLRSKLSWMIESDRLRAGFPL